MLYANWESASSPGEIALVTPGGRQGAGAHQVQRRARRAARPAAASRTSGSPAAAASASTASSCGRRVSTRRRNIRCSCVIHGGPHGMWRDQFFVRWNYHLLAAPGYVLLLTNYSGSTGFGEEFARSIQGDPLKGPADEINEAADAAIRKFPFIDGSRQCAGGASYGGHLSNWLQGIDHALQVPREPRRPREPRIAVGHQRHHLLARGQPGRAALGAGQRCGASRIRSAIAAKFRTPVLVTVGENDFRVPLNNTLEYWSALQRMQVPSRLIVFPDENHWIQKGEDSRLFYAEIGRVAATLAQAARLRRKGATRCPTSGISISRASTTRCLPSSSTSESAPTCRSRSGRGCCGCGSRCRRRGPMASRPTKRRRKLHEIGEALDADGRRRPAARSSSGASRATAGASSISMRPSPASSPPSVANAMKSFADVQVRDRQHVPARVGAVPRLLYPSDTNLERMQNRRLLEALAEQGDVHEVAAQGRALAVLRR